LGIWSQQIITFPLRRIAQAHSGRRKEPIQLIEAAAKAPAETLPGIGGLRRFKVVTTVEGLDRPTKTVTVKGPMGHYHTAIVDNPSRLTELRIGDKIVLTFTEAMAVSLEKGHKNIPNNTFCEAISVLRETHSLDGGTPIVAPIANRLYRRLSTGGGALWLCVQPSSTRRYSRLPIGATAQAFRVAVYNRNCPVFHAKVETMRLADARSK
jgi:hypothetical protein